MVCSSNKPMNSEATTPEGGHATAVVPEHQHHHHRHRRHSRRSFFDRRIVPYKRELKTAALFCIMILLAYSLWTSMVK